VLIDDRGAAGPCPVVACDLDGAGGAVVGDDDLFIGPGAVGADERRCPEQVRGHGVLGVLEGDHWGVLRDGSGEPERDRVRGVRDPVEPGASSASTAAGLRRMVRCSRLFTSSMNASQAASSSVKEA
jgi:hypothetical protein